jgi:hypothetical protein
VVHDGDVLISGHKIAAASEEDVVYLKAMLGGKTDKASQCHMVAEVQASVQDYTPFYRIYIIQLLKLWGDI